MNFGHNRVEAVEAAAAVTLAGGASLQGRSYLSGRGVTVPLGGPPLDIQSIGLRRITVVDAMEGVPGD